MSGAARRSRVLMFFGLAEMVIGALDPLEGSVVILTGTAIVAIGARLDHSLRRRLAYLSLALGPLVLTGGSSRWDRSDSGCPVDHERAIDSLRGRRGE